MKLTADSISFLHEFSKEEIIQWIKLNCSMHTPKKRDLLWIRWDIGQKELLLKREQLSKELRSIDTKQHDVYAREFNNTTDTKVKLALLEKMRPYEQALKEWFKKDRALTNEEHKLNGMFNSITKDAV